MPHTHLQSYTRYLKGHLRFSEDNATVVVHTFTMAAYSFTLLGGYISDAIWGKFKYECLFTHTIFTHMRITYVFIYTTCKLCSLTTT